ncbi:MAG: ABC transporter ATP-binding protein [Planctomycetota bacterium]|nr:ABC transporter ATP-binding protein [Planctomycetota bacterium]
MIRAEKLTKKYGPIQALSEVSFQVSPGEILGFLGPNGAGKSTAIKILCSYLPPTSGHAQIDGMDILDHSLKARKSVGYLPENFQAPPELRVFEYLQFRSCLKGATRKEARRNAGYWLERLDLADRVQQPIASLSKGLKQRVGLADALLADPKALLLDEPFGGLDPLQRDDFRTLLKELARKGKAILFSSHVLPEVENLADRVHVLHQGVTQADGSLAELSRKHQANASVLLRVASQAGNLLHQLKQEQSPVHACAIHQKGNTLTIQTPSFEARKKLLPFLAESEIELEMFHLLQPTLEDLFRDLVQPKENQ